MAASSSLAPSFADLTSAGQTRRLRRLALSALEAYEVSVCGLVRLHGWNTTFRVDGPNGERHVLRVQRTYGPTATMVGSELAWLLALGRDTDLAVPQPVANRFGDPITVAAAPGVPESRICVLFRWVRGRFLDAGLTETHLRRVGILTARLQQHGQTMSMLDGFDRRRAEEVTELEHLPRRATLRAALIAGYRSVRPLSAEQEAAVDDFIALRRLQLALWAVQHREQPMFADSWKADLLHSLAQLR